MPFTPFHMGPGILIKALLGGSFSLMVFGWTQIVMDIQPLVAMITGEGHVHGFSHTFFGGTLIAIISAISGLYLTRLMFHLFMPGITIELTWPVTIFSAFSGSFTHVIFDGIMHSDVQPFYPISLNNVFLDSISVAALHKFCLYSGLAGGGIYFYLQWWIQRKKADRNTTG